MSEANNGNPQGGAFKGNVDVGSGADQSGLTRENLQVTTGPTEGAEEGGEPYAVIGDQTFKTPEDLSKWYDEERAKERGEGGADTVAGEASTTAGTETDSTVKGVPFGDDVVRTDEEIIASLKEAGGVYANEHYQPAALEFEKTGTVSEETLKKTAEGLGVPLEFAQEFVKNAQIARDAQKATAGQPTAEQIALGKEIVSVIPDEGEYVKVLEWGREHLPEGIQKAYNAALDRNDGVTAKVLLTNILADYKAAGQGDPPRDVTTEGEVGSGGSAAEWAPFKNNAEMQEAINDPRYETSETYRQSVAKRIQGMSG